MNFAGLGDDSITGLVGRGRSAFVFEREDTLLDVCDNCTRMRVSARPDSGREFNGSHDDLVPWNGEVLGDQDLALDRWLCGDRNERHMAADLERQLAEDSPVGGHTAGAKCLDARRAVLEKLTREHCQHRELSRPVGPRPAPYRI